MFKQKKEKNEWKEIGGGVIGYRFSINIEDLKFTFTAYNSL